MWGKKLEDKDKTSERNLFQERNKKFKKKMSETGKRGRESRKILRK